MDLELAEPEIVSLDEFLIAGLAHRGRPEDDFEAIWTDFDERFDEFDGLTRTGEYYGVVYEYDRDSEEFTYVAGVPVEDAGPLSPKLTAVEIPASTFAVFETDAPETGSLLLEITETWAANTEYEPIDGPLFEYYGAGDEPTARSGGYEFYVPIEDDPDATDDADGNADAY